MKTNLVIYFFILLFLVVSCVSEDDNLGKNTDDETIDTITGNAVCGDKTVASGEDCDGNAVSCSTLDSKWSEGIAVCTEECTWDTSACNTASSSSSGGSSGSSSGGSSGSGSGGSSSGGTDPENIPDTETSKILTVSVGSEHVCAIKESGHLYCWGLNGRGQLGLGGAPSGQRTPTARPSRVGNEAWKEVMAVFDATCGIKRNGNLYCWGFNSDGQLASGQDGVALQASANPMQVITGDPSNNYHTISGGDLTFMAFSGEEVYGWGQNMFGQMATGKTGYGATAYTARKISNDNWPAFTYLSPGRYHTCGISDSDTLYCWGSYDYGQFGDGRKGDGMDTMSFRINEQKYNEFNAPLQIGSDTWKDIASMYRSTCGIKTDGTLWCWGSNVRGQLGIGEDFTSNEGCGEAFESTDGSQKVDYPAHCTTPQQVGTATNWVDVDGMLYSACALNNIGEIWCWGFNDWGTVGNGVSDADPYDFTYIIEWAPSKVKGDHTFSKLSVGHITACGITKESKELYCWGGSDLGECGTTQQSVTTPIKVAF